MPLSNGNLLPAIKTVPVLNRDRFQRVHPLPVHRLPIVASSAYRTVVLFRVAAHPLIVRLILETATRAKRRTAMVPTRCVPSVIRRSMGTVPLVPSTAKCVSRARVASSTKVTMAKVSMVVLRRLPPFAPTMPTIVTFARTHSVTLKVSCIRCPVKKKDSFVLTFHLFVPLAPILCFSCTDCRDVLTPIIQKTKLCGTEGDSCITALIDGRIDRDCRSDLPHPIEEYTVIEECDTSNCNRLSITDWTSCYVCTGCNDVLGAEVTTELCLNPPTDTCFTKREDDGVIVRGCATEDGLVGCDSGLNCDVCPGENCNDRAVPQEFSCVQCDLSEDCAQYNVLSECPNTLGLLVDSCVTYTKQPDGVQKGCISTPDLYALCYGTSNDDCVVSEESMGNARPVQCIDCIESVECIRGEANELITNSYHHGSCVSFLDEQGTVVRGNIVNYPEFQNAPHYKECFEDGCNKGLFPEDRLLCYQCGGEECARLTQSGSSITPQPCLRYDKANAKCYTWYESASNAQRGCLLDDGDDSPCGGEGVQSCKTCSDSRCNELDYAAFSETNVCVKCTTNRGCQENLAEEACTEGGGCYTFFSGSLVVAKGCVSELAESMEWYEECARGSESERCQQCYGDYCNRNKCYACNSGLGSATDCIEPRLGLTESATCRTDDGCVAFIDGKLSTEQSESSGEHNLTTIFPNFSKRSHGTWMQRQFRRPNCRMFRAECRHLSAL